MDKELEDLIAWKTAAWHEPNMVLVCGTDGGE